MTKFFNFRIAFAGITAASLLLLSGCSKEKVETTAATLQQTESKKISLNERQSRAAQDMFSRMPRLRYWDEANHRFIERKAGSRDLVFADPDEGFTFD